MLTRVFMIISIFQESPPFPFPAYAYWKGGTKWYNAFPITRQGRTILGVTRLRCEYCTWFQTRRWYRWNCGRGGKNWNVWGEKLERFLLETILAREDETMVTAKLLTLRRIKATSRLRGGTRNTRKPVASSAHEGCVVFANGSTLPILICVNTLDAFISEESIKAFLVLRNVFDVCHAYFRTKINAGRTISFFFFKFCETEVYYFSLRSKKKHFSFLLMRYTLSKILDEMKLRER